MWRRGEEGGIGRRAEEGWGREKGRGKVGKGDGKRRDGSVGQRGDPHTAQ